MKKRLVSLLLSLTMVVGLLPISAAAEVPAAAAAETTAARKQQVQLAAKSTLGYDAATKTYDRLYFGTYHAEANDTGTPYAWRILDGQTSLETDGLFLLSMPVYTGIRFSLPNSEATDFWKSPHNEWTSAGCAARAWCKSMAASDQVFSDVEKTALLTTSKESARYTSKNSFMSSYYGSVKDSALENDQLFYLSGQEFEDDRYGLLDVDSYDTGTFGLRSAAGESYTVDDVTIYDGSLAVAMQGYGASYMRVARIYHKEFSGFTLPKELTAAEKFFQGSTGDFGFFSNFFPNGAEEEYTYKYNEVVARPAMNLDGSKLLYLVPADNSARATYGETPTTETLEWKAVLKNDDADFKANVSLTSAPANNLFGVEGGTVTVAHPALNTLSGYTALTASLTDRDGKVIRYGTLTSDETATSSELTVPANLPDGVYTLRVTAEQHNGAKQTDLAAEPFEAELKVANVHTHTLCSMDGCTEHGEPITWSPVTSTEDLAAMQPDGHYFLIGNVAAPETPCVGHLCVNNFSITGTLKAGTAEDSFTLCNCVSTTTVSVVAVQDGATFTQFG